MMKKATGKTRRNGKERRADLWAVSLIVSFQVVGLVLFSMATSVPVEAKAFIVNNTLDEADTDPGDGVCVSASGYCTLRAAIQEANALLDLDVINLKPGLYMLTIAGISENDCATGDLDITDDLAIIGKGAKNTFINGGKVDRVFHIIGPISVTMTDVTIQNGLATDNGQGDMNNVHGAGVLNESGSTLTLKGVTISNNAAVGGDFVYGGGIYNLGTLTIRNSTLSNSTISNNSVSSPLYASGGGIYNLFGTLTITKGTLSNNSASSNSASGQGVGGGIFNSDGTLTIIQSTVSNNIASSPNIAQGGGMYSGDAPLTITGSTIFNNVARADNLSMGGGIRCLREEVVITGSTISGNSASGGFSAGVGGGIFVGDGTLTVRNSSKIIRNFSSDAGGGIIYVGSGTGNISGDSTVAKNVPDDIYP